MEIYIDIIFVINTVLNYLILLVTAKICDVAVSRKRLLLSAMLGGLYSAAVAIFGFEYVFLKSAPIKIIFGVLMVLAAFGKERGLFRIAVVFFLASAMFAGCVLAVSYMSGQNSPDWIYRPVSLKILILSFAVSYAVISFFYRRAARKLSGGGIFKVRAETTGGNVEFTALHDTGNSLSDPFSGDHVIITDLDTAKPLFTPEIWTMLSNELLKKPIQAMSQIYAKDSRYRLRLVPYKAVGIKNGFLLAIKPNAVYIDGRRRNDMLIALSPNRVSAGEKYSALIGGEMI